MEANQIFKKSIFIAIIYWIGATIRSAALVDDAGFVNQLFAGTTVDLAVRIVFAAAILFIGWKLQQHFAAVEGSTEKAEADRENYQKALDQLGAGVAVLDSDGRVARVNESLRRTIGYGVSDLLGKNFIDTVVEEDYRSEAKQKLQKAAQGSRESLGDMKLRSKTSEPVSAVLSAGPIQESDMEESGTLVIAQDIAELQNELNQTKEHLHAARQAIRSAALPAALISDNNWTLEVASSQIQERAEGAEDWMGATFGPEQKDTVQQAMRSCLEEYQVCQVPFNLNGTDYLGDMIPVVDGTGQSRVFFMASDVTSLKGEIRDLESKLDAIRGTVSEKQQEITELEQQVNQINKEKAEAESEKDSLASSLEQSESEIRALQERETALEKEVEEKEEDLREQKQMRESLESEKRDLQERQSELAEELESLQQHRDTLTEQIENWKAFLQTTGLPLAILDSSGQIEVFNSGIEEMVGRTESDMLGRPLKALLTKESEAEQFEEDLRAALQGEPVPVRMVDLAGPEDDAITAVLSLELRQEPNRPPQIWAVFQNITPLRQDRNSWKQAAKAHRLELETMLSDVEYERDRINGIIQAIDDGIIVTDVYHRVLQMNRAAEDMLGVRLSEVLDRPVRFVLEDSKYSGELERTIAERLKRHEFDVDGETSGLDSDFNIAANLVEDKNKKGICVVTRLRRK